VVNRIEFEWDESNCGHIAGHQVEPQEAEEVILNNPVDLERQNRNGEDRILQLGESNAGRVLVVISTFSGSKIRVISAWAAKERLARYWKSLQSNAERRSHDR
jgi:uncharacterized DUF497 family protein